MTSPVDFISGPRRMSTPGKRLKGNTDSFTEMCRGSTSLVSPSSFKVRPTITLVASLARGTPIALLTKGMVLEALGLTSNTKTFSSLIANWMFIRPTTFSSLAMALVLSLICSTIEGIRP